MEKLNNSHDPALHHIWLSRRNKVGNVRAKLLMDYFGSAENVYNSSREELASIGGMTYEMINSLMDKNLSSAEKILISCKKLGFTVLPLCDENYPDRLRNIYDPPTVLYIWGNLPCIDAIPVVGIVGSRRCTPYGIKHAKLLGRELSQHGIAVTTGLAKGIDTAAAEGALCGDAPVVGVIGSGVDIVFPAENKELFAAVADRGAVISEYPPGTEARPELFPARNRIISGIANGVAVIEAPRRSGALITAQRTAEQNRDLFVLPGNVDSKACEGSNKLLRLGAIPFLTAEDIIDEYRDLFCQIKKPIDNNEEVDYIDVDKFVSDLNDGEKAIVKSIGRDCLYVDEIIEKTGIDAQSVMITLTGLELCGYIKRNNTGKWEIIK